MQRRRILLANLGAALALSACVAELPGDEAAALGGELRARDVDVGSDTIADDFSGSIVVSPDLGGGGFDTIIVPPPDPTPAGCDRNRQIGVLTRGFACPAPEAAGWVGRPLFRTPTSGADRRSYVVSPWGTGFCLYEYVGDPASFSRAGLPSDRTGVDDAADGVPASQWLHADCPVVAALGDHEDAAAAVAGAYENAYLRQMDALSSYPLPALTAPVEIALLDSSPDSGLATIEPTIDPAMIHGRAVGMAIRRVAFPAAASPERRIPYFHSWRALRSDRRGYIGELAEVIERAVRNRRGDAGGRLVLSLALGFHPEFGIYRVGGDNDNLRAHALAVMSALNYATCQGAISIIAAGNTEEGPSPDERPMYPAAFAVDNAWTCTRSPVARPGVPVAYAVSGVGALDQPLPNGRGLARSTLVAPAYAVTVADDQAALPVMTGSSFAAAGASAVAALVWGHYPSATAQQVMQLVRDSAVELASPATLCAGVSCGNSRRVSACRGVVWALAARCAAGDSSACLRRGSAPRCQPFPNAQVALDPDLISDLITPADAVLEPAGAGDGQCGGAWYADADVAVTPQSMCPDAHYTNGLHIEQNGPQPGSDPCEVCAITRTGAYSNPDPSLVLALRPGWSSQIMSGALHVGGQRYLIPPAALASSYQNVTTIALPQAAASGSSPYLSFRTVSNSSVVVPLVSWSAEDL